MSAKKKKSVKRDQAVKKEPGVKKSGVKSGSLAWIFERKLHLIFIFCFSFVLYGNTLFNGYTQDDAIVITQNEFTKSGLSGLGGILSEDTFFGFFGQKKDLVVGGRYRPLSLVTFAFEYQFFKETPWVSHLGNIILYGLTGVLLYLVLGYLLNPLWKTGNVMPWFISLAATLIFMAHPIHTEAVANIKGRDEILSLLGSLAALYFLLKAHFEKGGNMNILAGVCFFLALLSKENAITFLAVIPAALFLFAGLSPGSIFKKMIPLFIAAIVFIGIRSAVLGGISIGDPPMELMNNPYLKLAGNTYVPFTVSEKLSTITYTMGKYIQLLVAPVVLTHDYYPKYIDLVGWGNWKVILSILFYAFLIVFAILKFRKEPLISFGIFLFLATLSIVSNVVFPVGVHMSERFMYMPSVGFSLIVAVLFYKFAGKPENPSSLKFNGRSGIAMLGLAAILLLFTVKTFSRNLVWKDNYTLFTTDVKTSVNSAKLQNAAGGEIIARALENKVKAIKNLPNPQDKIALEAIDQQFMNEVNTAIPHLEEALKIHPTYANPYLQLGNANNYLKRYDEAFRFYNIALQYKNPFPEVTQNMGTTYKEAGQYYGEKVGDFPKAISYLTEALKYENNEANEVNRLMALCYASMGQSDRAIGIMTELIRLEPNNSIFFNNLSSMYGQRGQITGNPEDLAKAEEYRKKSEQLNQN